MTPMPKSSLASHIPLGTVLACPQKAIGRAGLILLTGIFIGVFVPGFLYRLCGTFYRADIAYLLPDSSKTNSDPKGQWEAYIATKMGLNKSIVTIDERIASY